MFKFKFFFDEHAQTHISSCLNPSFSLLNIHISWNIHNTIFNKALMISSYLKSSFSLMNVVILVWKIFLFNFNFNFNHKLNQTFHLKIDFCLTFNFYSDSSLNFNNPFIFNPYFKLSVFLCVIDFLDILLYFVLLFCALFFIVVVIVYRYVSSCASITFKRYNKPHSCICHSVYYNKQIIIFN
jgi:hypothetical protein